MKSIIVPSHGRGTIDLLCKGKYEVAGRDASLSAMRTIAGRDSLKELVLRFGAISASARRVDGHNQFTAQQMSASTL